MPSLPGRATYEAFFKLFLGGLFSLVLSFPAPAHAGVFSFLSSWLRETAEARVAEASPAEARNSQTIPLLKAAVNIDPNPAKGGGDITIVDDSALLAETGPSGSLADIEEGHGGEISIYVVREGDSLSQIAKMFGVSVSTIIWANDIARGGTIRPGQTLVILPISGVRHTVAKGDTLRGIAKRYGGDLEEILRYNGLSEDAALAVGSVVIVPDGEIPGPKPGVSSSGAVVRGAGGPEYVGYYLRPVLGGRKTQGLHGYNGVDIAAPPGTPIMAAAAGTVLIARDYGWNGGYGNYIVIEHDNGTQTLYAHNQGNIVVAGQRVVQGQVIGYVGATGKVTGPHLHFEIRGARNPF